MARPEREVLNDFADQMEELANSLRRLSQLRDEPARTGEDEPPLPLDVMAERLLSHRHARAKFLPPSLFHEPAWEVLLSLYVAQTRGRTLNVKHLVQEVDAPVTTSQRWVDALAHMKLVQRITDPVDRRRIELSLTDHATQAIERYLRWMAEQTGTGRERSPTQAGAIG